MNRSPRCRPREVSTSAGGEAADSARLYHAAAVLVSGSPQVWPRGLSARIATAGRNGEWPGDLIEALAPAVAEQSEALALADRARPLRFAGFALESSDPALTGRVRTLAALCAFRAVVRAAAGDGDGAMRSIAAEAAVARGLEGVMLPRFTEIAYVLERARPTPPVRADAAAALARIDRDDRLVAYFTELRLNAVKEFERMRRGRHLEDIVLAPLLTHRLVTVIDGTSRLIDAARKPWPDRIDAVSRAKWPFDTAGMFQTRARAIAEDTKAVRCARLLIADGALDLVDPFTGGRLEMVNCR